MNSFFNAYSTSISMFLFMGLPFSIFVGVLGTLIQAFPDYQKHKKYRNAVWKHAFGSIIQSRIEEIKDDGTFFTANIEYAYTYDNTSYTSNVITADFHPAIGWKNQKTAEKWISIFPKNTTVNVFVDSKNPKTSVLFPEYRFQWNQVPFVFCTFFGLSTILWLLAIFGTELFQSHFIQKIFS